MCPVIFRTDSTKTSILQKLWWKFIYLGFNLKFSWFWKWKFTVWFLKWHTFSKIYIALLKIATVQRNLEMPPQKLWHCERKLTGASLLYQLPRCKRKLFSFRQTRGPFSSDSIEIKLHQSEVTVISFRFKGLHLSGKTGGVHEKPGLDIRKSA